VFSVKADNNLLCVRKANVNTRSSCTLGGCIVAAAIILSTLKPVKCTLAASPSAEEAEVLKQLAHSRAICTTAYTWAERQQQIREGFLKGVRLWPLPDRAKVKAIVHSLRKYDGYSVENVALETLPGFYCTGNLYRPLRQEESGPAILCPHGHFIPLEPGTAGGRFREEHQVRCAHLARMGATVFSYSMVGWHDSQQHSHADSFAVVLQTWNSLRAVDYVLALPKVDSKRLGVTGASGGGTQTLHLTLAEPRVRASSPVVIVSPRAPEVGCHCERVWMMPRTNLIEMAAAIAPRPQLLISVGTDPTRDFPTNGFPFVKHFYELTGNADAATNVHFPKEEHDFGPNKRKAVYEFFAKHLKMTLIAEDPSKITIEKPNQMEVFNAKHPLPADAVQGNKAVAAAFDTLRRGDNKK